MRKSDFATAILIAGLVTILAAVIANVLFGDPNDEQISVKYMDVIHKEIAEPNGEIFNPHAINPTVETYVGRCKENEIWDVASGTCVSNAPATPPATETPPTTETPTTPAPGA